MGVANQEEVVTDVVDLGLQDLIPINLDDSSCMPRCAAAGDLLKRVLAQSLWLKTVLAAEGRKALDERTVGKFRGVCGASLTRRSRTTPADSTNTRQASA